MRSVIAGLLFGLLTVGHGVAHGQEVRSGPVRVLIVVGGSHDIFNLPPILEARLAQEGGFEVSRLGPPAETPRDLAHLTKLATLSRQQYDVVLTYLIAPTLDPANQRGLERFLEEGAGIVALHGSSASFKESDAWHQMLGGWFLGHLRGTHPLKVSIVDRRHPVTAGVADFEAIDEEYCHELTSGVERHVLARFAARPEGSLCPNGPAEMMWTRQIGRGRVFYNSLGHDAATWKHPAWQQLVIQGLRWAAGK